MGLLEGPDNTLREVRTLDIHTGEVKSVHLGLPELVRGASLSADKKRLVAFRGWAWDEPAHAIQARVATYTLL